MQENSNVGYVQIFTFKTLTRYYAEMHDLRVHGYAEGQGIGTALIKEVVGWCKEFATEIQKPVHLRFTSGPHRKAANHLYRKLDFTLLAEATSGGTNYYGLVLEPGTQEAKGETDG